MRGIKNSARIQMIFGWRVPPAKRDELVTTPARNVNPASGLDPKMVESILAAVCEEEIVAMACDVINIPSPTGKRQQMAEYMRGVFRQMGLTVTWQEVEEGRANVVGRWLGSGGGKNLMFNGHMDTSNTVARNLLPHRYKPHAIVKDGVIYGLGIYNMKGALVCYGACGQGVAPRWREAQGRRVHSGRRRRNREETQWGEYKGKEYRGYGYGTHYLGITWRASTGHVHPGRAEETCASCWSTFGSSGCDFVHWHLRPHGILQRREEMNSHPPHA